MVSAEESIFSGEARFVALPGEAGELGIYPRHTPLITRIKPGSVRIEKADGTEEFVFVAGGMLEVQPNCVTVLSDTAIRGKDLDEEKANEAKAAAEEALRNAKGELDIAKAQSELAVMAAQIAALRKYRQKQVNDCGTDQCEAIALSPTDRVKKRSKRPSPRLRATAPQDPARANAGVLFCALSEPRSAQDRLVRQLVGVGLARRQREMRAPAAPTLPPAPASGRLRSGLRGRRVPMRSHDALPLAADPPGWLRPRSATISMACSASSR